MTLHPLGTQEGKSVDHLAAGTVNPVSLTEFCGQPRDRNGIPPDVLIGQRHRVAVLIRIISDPIKAKGRDADRKVRARPVSPRPHDFGRTAGLF